jgi:hypothetical protein
MSLTIGTNKYTFTAPSGGDVHLLALRLRGTTSGSGTFDINISGTSLTNGVGDNTGLADSNIPLFRISTNADTLSAVAATIAVNNAAVGYNEYRFSGAGTSLVRIFSMNF